MSGRSMEDLMPDGSSVDFPEKTSELDQRQAQDSEPEQSQGDSDKKKIKFDPKPLRDHGHMRHGPIQGQDAGEEAAAMMCNFVWSFAKGGGRRIGGLIVAVPKYGASHLAAFLKSQLKGGADAELAEGEFVAEDGDRIATKEDFVKLDIDPDVVERFNTALNDRNIDSLQIANPDGSMKFIIKAHDIDAVNQALDDIIGVPDKELDEQHAVVAQAQEFAQDGKTAQEQDASHSATIEDKAADYRNSNWNIRSVGDGEYAFDYQRAATKTFARDVEEVKRELSRFGFSENKDYSVTSSQSERSQAAAFANTSPAALAFLAANPVYTFTFSNVDAEKTARIDSVLDVMSEGRFFEQEIDDGKKDARQRGLERAQEYGNERRLAHDQERDAAGKDLNRQKSRDGDQGR